MVNFVFVRIFKALLTLWLTVTLAFFALRLLSGDAIEAQLAGSGQAESVIAMRRADLGLDQALHWQYLHFLGRALQGDLGLSLYGGQTVVEILQQRFMSTLELGTSALLIAIAWGLSLGIGSLEKRVLGLVCRLMLDLSFSLPIYWTATLVLFVFNFSTRDNLLLPSLILGFHTAGGIARITATSLNEISQTDFIRTARSKGLSERYILFQHSLRVAALPIITVIALQTGLLLSGTVITETIFLRAGLGSLLVSATLDRNYPVVQGAVLVITLIYISANTLADVASLYLDPRIRL